MQVALYPASVAAVTASDSSALAWKGDLLALGVFEEAITPGKGAGAHSTPCMGCFWRPRRRATAKDRISGSCLVCESSGSCLYTQQDCLLPSQHARILQ